MKYTVKNYYDISGESKHKNPTLALKACDKREGEGWYVCDDNGDLYDWDFSQPEKRALKMSGSYN